MCSTAHAYAFSPHCTRSQVKGITSRRRWRSPSAQRQSWQMVDLEKAETTVPSAAMVNVLQARSPAYASHHPMSPHRGSPGRLPPCPFPPPSSLLRRALVAGPSTGWPAFVRKRTAAVGAAAGVGGVGRVRCAAGPHRAVRRPGADVWHWALVACECVYVRSYIRILFVATAHGVTRRVQGRRAAGVRSRNFARNKKS